ncbi:hypothetical protein BJ165DRAFT_1519778 [Panaeolus papilionaceus]|nr:hypothetical protein BJ165DRAFT_1519778 [Panaeolus papilionaceus]
MDALYPVPVYHMYLLVLINSPLVVPPFRVHRSHEFHYGCSDFIHLHADDRIADHLLSLFIPRAEVIIIFTFLQHWHHFLQPQPIPFPCVSRHHRDPPLISLPVCNAAPLAFFLSTVISCVPHPNS